MTFILSKDDAFANWEDGGDLEPPLATSLTGPTPTWYKELYENEEETLSSGFWKCEPGESRWEFVDNGEVIYVFEGRMTVQEDGHDPIEVGPGDSVTFPIGWKGNWTIHETLSKFYVIYA